MTICKGNMKINYKLVAVVDDSKCPRRTAARSV